ncbi:MAG: hypothetical protein H0T60_04885 [Acidobacteria bacterium]|nr:hypothetical protein [Acidobacteriota bacterium]
MRRIMSLIVLLLCCAITSQAQDDTGQSPEIPEAQANLTSSLKALKQIAIEQESKQTLPRAKALNKQIREKLGAEFASDEDFTPESIGALDSYISSWKRGADDLVSGNPKLRDGNLIKQINTVFDQNNGYKKLIDVEKHEKKNDTPRGDEGHPVEQPRATEDFATQWLPLVAMIGMSLLAVALFALIFFAIRKTRRELGDASTFARQAVTALKNKQDGFTKQLENLAAADSDLFTRLAELSAEISAMNSTVRGLRGASAVAAAMSPAGDGIPLRQPEPPAFPVSADVYLRKMQRYATVVKPDFQNGILVADADNRGELVLVQDASISHDSLFIIPRVTQFQMKQDFFTYYERYYDCERPASGTVWIVDPAVAERVQGGWELREKGLLEVR